MSSSLVLIILKSYFTFPSSHLSRKLHINIELKRWIVYNVWQGSHFCSWHVLSVLSTCTYAILLADHYQQYSKSNYFKRFFCLLQRHFFLSNFFSASPPHGKTLQGSGLFWASLRSNAAILQSMVRMSRCQAVNLKIIVLVVSWLQYMTCSICAADNSHIFQTQDARWADSFSRFFGLLRLLQLKDYAFYARMRQQESIFTHCIF